MSIIAIKSDFFMHHFFWDTLYKKNVQLKNSVTRSIFEKELSTFSRDTPNQKLKFCCLWQQVGAAPGFSAKTWCLVCFLENLMSILNWEQDGVVLLMQLRNDLFKLKRHQCFILENALKINFSNFSF